MKKSTGIIVFLILLSVCLVFAACENVSNETITELAHTHKYGEWTTHIHATCIAKGEERRYCECGFYQNREMEIDPNAHDLIYHEGKEKTCTENGWKEYDTCSRCDYSTYSVILAAHDYGEPTVASAPTCTSGGIEVLTCVVCGKNVRRSLDALGHSYMDWETTKQPNCVEFGERERVCTRCGDAEKATLDALGHKFGDWRITKQATCMTGVKERVCSVCSYIEKADIPADFTAHVFEDGICSICGEHTATDGLLFEMLTDTTVAVSGYTGTSTVVHIPSSYYGAIVTEIKADAFKDKTTITEITVPNSVTTIGSAAFRGCSSLVSMTTPFVGGTAGKTASDTDQYPFGYIFGTSSYTGGTAVKQQYYTTYYIPSSLRSVTVTGGNVLYGAFYNCSGLTSITIPDSVTSIGDYAFYNCSGLTSITIPDSVTSIGDYAFESCSGLTSITIPDSVTSIGDYAFSGCSGLTSIYYTGDVAGWCGIAGLYNLMICGSSTKSLYISGAKVDDLVIPDGVTSIGPFAFAFYRGLTSITIPDSVRSIGDFAFWSCSGLTSVTFAEGSQLTSIGDGAFLCCSDLTSITIPDGVTSIGDGAFESCSGLTTITIPDSVTSIGGAAFRYCSDLTSVTYQGTKAQWNAISKGLDWDEATGTYTITCTDGWR